MEDAQDKTTKEMEIDLLALAKKLWQARRFILKVLAAGFIAGLVIAFSIPKEYTATVILTPESQSTASGNMGSLAALAGVNLGNAKSEDALASPDLYPDVFRSTPFLRGLFNINVKDAKQGMDTTLYAYLKNHQKGAWWTHVLKAPDALTGIFSSGDPVSNVTVDNNSRVLSKKEMSVIEVLHSRLTVSSDKKTGVTTIEVTMQSPEIAAFLADSLISYFQSYIINYRTQKARKDLAYAEMLYEEAKADYYKTQANLAAFIDGNMNVVSAKFRTTQERLQNEANSAYTVYNQMAQQLQMAKVKVQDTTPVLTVIQPAIEPLSPSKPSKKMILAGILFLSFLAASVWIIRKDLWNLVVADNTRSYP
ncbi:MAG: chain-length determining protein [Prevotella sp.]|jgi:uncharacterized protein involved in exopolysaccharide biosynthesis|nr:chain-length determining protein [Prevotella sp.]